MANFQKLLIGMKKFRQRLIKLVTINFVNQKNENSNALVTAYLLLRETNARVTEMGLLGS